MDSDQGLNFITVDYKTEATAKVTQAGYYGMWVVTVMARPDRRGGTE